MTDRVFNTMDHSTTIDNKAASPTPSSNHRQAIQNRHRLLQRLVFQMQHLEDSYRDNRNDDALLHSKITVRGDASHLSAISGDSRTVHSECSKNPPLSVLQEGDDVSFFSGRSSHSGSNSEKHGSRTSSRRNSQSSGREGGGSSSRYQEVKDDFEDNVRSSSSSRHSREPEGEYEYQPQVPSKSNTYENAMRARKEAVDRYSSVARKKASLMTNHNFDKEKKVNPNNRSNCSGEESRASSRRDTSVRKSKSPPPPPFSVQSEHTFLGKSIAPDDGSSVSSMTSMDSYMKQQCILRELERLRERESRDRHYHSRSEVRGSRGHEDSRHGRMSSYNDDRAARPRSERDHSRRSTPANQPRSRSMPRDRKTRSGSDLESIWEQTSKGGAHHSSSHSSSSKSRHSSHQDSKRNNNNLHKSQTCAQSHSTSHTPPLSQIEECCIKHPHILLSDQSDVNIWTCMRYCKDETTGRWVTKKKVCEACLQDDEESANRHHYYHHPDKSDYLDERTHSMSSSEEDEYSNQNNKNTVNVYTDDGNQTPLEREAEAQRRRFIRRLAARAYHFPGNTWCEDWTQYIANTHIVFGIFFHHPLHPVTSRERLIILLGSVAVGLLMSNLIYLWFLHENFGMNDVILHIAPGLDVTKLMICLWTLGSFVHTIFDLSVWHIKACTLCRYGGEVSDTAVECGRRSVSYTFFECLG